MDLLAYTLTEYLACSLLAVVVESVSRLDPKPSLAHDLVQESARLEESLLRVLLVPAYTIQYNDNLYSACPRKTDTLGTHIAGRGILADWQ